MTSDRWKYDLERAEVAVTLARRCLASRGPVVLPPTLYDRAEALGLDMRGYIKSAPLPVGPVKRSECRCVCHTDAVALGQIAGPMHVQPCCVEDRVGASDKPRWPCPGDRKSGARYCGGVTCMPGRGGTCVACSDDD